MAQAEPPSRGKLSVPAAPFGAAPPSQFCPLDQRMLLGPVSGAAPVHVKFAARAGATASSAAARPIANLRIRRISPAHTLGTAAPALEKDFGRASLRTPGRPGSSVSLRSLCP